MPHFIRNMKQLYIHKTSNGVKIIFVSSNSQLSCVSLWLPAGSRNDKNGKEGVAHLCEHLLMRKTKVFKDYYNRNVALEKCGIMFNAQVNRDFAVFYNIQSAQNSLKSLDFLLDGHLSSTFSASDLTQEKKTIKNELTSLKSNSYQEIWHKFFEAHVGQDFSKSLFGSVSSIDDIKQVDIRNFIENFYFQSPAFVVIGNVDKEKIISEIEKKYKNAVIKNIQVERGDDHLKLNREFKINVENKYGLFYSYNQQLNIHDMAALDVLASYLGNNWSSVLLNSLRVKKPLAYWVSVESGQIKNLSYIGILLDIEKENYQESENIIKKEINKIRQGRVDKKILEAAKNTFITNLNRRLSDVYEYAWWYGSQIFTESELTTPEAYLKAIKNVDQQAISKTASLFFDVE